MPTGLLVTTLMFALLSAGAPVQPNDVGAQLTELRAAQGAYRPPTNAEYEALRQALPAAMDAVVDADVDRLVELRPLLAGAGFEVTAVDVADEQWAVFHERTARGAGAYVFRMGPVRHELIVQAPHADHDRGTGEIAFRTFASQSVRGYYVNTTHRYGGKGRKHGKRCDVAHHEHSFFQQFTTEALRAIPHTTVAQVHGFANEDLARQGVDIVVSNGTQTPDPLTREIATRLGDQLRLRSLVFGDSTRHYGATKNVTGRWIREHRLGRFVHVELSARARGQVEALRLAE